MKLDRGVQEIWGAVSLYVFIILSLGAIPYKE